MYFFFAVYFFSFFVCIFHKRCLGSIRATPPPQVAQIMENEEDENEEGEENIFHSLCRHRYAFEDD